jgi:hypothetical protein
MSQHHPELVAEIEAFMALSDMTETSFGRRAMGDPHFVRDVRGKRRLWPQTVAKVREFIVAHTLTDTAPQQSPSPGKSGDLAAQTSEAA